MRITEVIAQRVVVPLARGYVMANQSVIGHRETVLVTIRTADGLTGVGEAPAAPHWPLGSTADEAVNFIDQILAPMLIGADSAAWQELLDQLARHAQGAPFPLAGIDIALHDLAAVRRGVPVWNLLGKQRRRQIAVHYSLGIGDLANTVAEAQRAADAGFTAFKCKVGRPDGDEEVRVLQALRIALGPHAVLRVDANGAWSVAEAINQIQALHRVSQLAFVEQPIAGPDLSGLDRVARGVPVAIMPDESVTTLADIQAIADLGSIPFINLKVAQLGGLRQAMKANHLCADLGLTSFVGMVAEVGPARTARIHFAVAAATADLGTGTGISVLPGTGGVTEPHSSVLSIPHGAGLSQTQFD